MTEFMSIYGPVSIGIAAVAWLAFITWLSVIIDGFTEFAALATLAIAGALLIIFLWPLVITAGLIYLAINR